MAITENELPPTVALAGNPMWVDCETDEHAEDFIGLHYDAEVYLDGAWQSAAQEMRFEPDADHKAVVDLSKLLQWDPEKEFTYPDTGSIIIKRNNLRRQWRLFRSEKYGNPLVEYNDAYASGTRYILPGKISDLKQGQINSLSSDWWSYLATKKWFLSNAPRSKKTDASAIEKLYYIIFGAAVTSIRMSCRIHYTDGTTATYYLNSSFSAVQYDVCELICSYTALDLDSYSATKTVAEYDIWLVDQSLNIISEEFSFLLDRIQKPNARYFIFQNSYKMYEGIRFAGKSSDQSKISFQEFVRQRTKGYTEDTHSLLREFLREQHIIQVSSDWLSRDEINWYRELLLSREVYEVINNVLLPVSILTTQVQLSSDMSNLISLSIEYVYGTEDSVPDDYFYETIEVPEENNNLITSEGNLLVTSEGDNLIYT